MAGGSPFLDMETQKAIVLYVNFEISQENLQERVQDLRNELGITPPADLLLVSPRAMA
ncbi:MAG: AAA family ATPase, partial [Candidatus Dadabacteria bacterium]|nr:AAA family ATPase [Candidatus Dadabacteria bacterium]